MELTEYLDNPLEIIDSKSQPFHSEYESKELETKSIKDLLENFKDPAATDEEPFAVSPSKMLRTSLNKPIFNAPLAAPMASSRGNHKPRAPTTMVVNSVYPSPYPIRKDCCHQCKLIFNHKLDFLLHKYKNHPPKRPLIHRSRYKSCSNCLKQFLSKKALENHSYVCVFRNHKHYVCSGCSQRFNNYMVLKRHEKLCYIPKLLKQV